MQKSFDMMTNSPMDLSQLMNIPGLQIMNMSDLENMIPKQQKIKKKKEGEKSNGQRFYALKDINLTLYN